MRALIADIGGTNTRLQLCNIYKNKISVVFGEYYPSQNYTSLAVIIDRFFDTIKIEQAPEIACFAAAGPVRDGRVELTNLPWSIDAAEISDTFDISEVYLINDVEAAAYGVYAQNITQHIVIQAGNAVASAPSVLINIGTGFGQALRINNQSDPIVIASEGGHVDFAPADDFELGLLHYLRLELTHVSIETLLSGAGLTRIYQYLGSLYTDDGDVTDISSFDIVANANNGELLAIDAIGHLLDIAANHIANVILTYLPLSGVYIMGSMFAALYRFIEPKRFTDRLIKRGIFTALIQSVPIQLVLGDDLGLVGAAKVAQIHLRYNDEAKQNPL